MSIDTPINESASSATIDNVQTALDAVVAVYTTEEGLAGAVKHLEREHYDMSSISVLGKGMGEQRHVIGFDTPEKRTARWAKWGGLWGWVFGALLFVPGVGHVAIGGYLPFVLMTTGVGAAGGALSSVGIPKEGIPVYEADLRADRFLVIAHGTPNMSRPPERCSTRPTTTASTTEPFPQSGALTSGCRKIKENVMSALFVIVCHPWGHREVTIPMLDVDSVSSDRIRLRLTRNEVRALPSAAFHHHASRLGPSPVSSRRVERDSR